MNENTPSWLMIRGTDTFQIGNGEGSKSPKRRKRCCLLTETYDRLILRCSLQWSLWVQPGFRCTIDSAALQFREALAGYEKWKINRENRVGAVGARWEQSNRN